MPLQIRAARRSRAQVTTGRLRWPEELVRQVLTTESRKDVLSYPATVTTYRMLSALRGRLRRTGYRLLCVSDPTDNTLQVWCQSSKDDMERRWLLGSWQGILDVKLLNQRLLVHRARKSNRRKHKTS
jgi:hypothetical protein